MNPILSKQVQRGNGSEDDKTLREWTPAENHLTVAGLNAFAERQRKRMTDAEKARANVTPISKRKQSK